MNSEDRDVGIINGGDVQKPLCPICMELPYDPRVGSCGHTLCIGCMEKIKSSICPLCQKKVTFRVNFMLRDILIGGQYASEYKIRQHEHYKSTPAGIIDSYKSRYPDMKINSTMDLEDQSKLLCEAERWILHRRTQKNFSNFSFKYKLDSVLICTSTDFYSIMSGRNSFNVFLGDYFFQSLSPTKKLKLVQ